MDWKTGWGVLRQTAKEFIDDNALNVEAAARLGINARKAIGPSGVRAVLRELNLF